MGHATADDMLARMQEAMDENLKKVIQVSMDGPNVNQKLFRLMSEHIQVGITFECVLHTSLCILLVNMYIDPLNCMFANSCLFLIVCF